MNVPYLHLNKILFVPIFVFLAIAFIAYNLGYFHGLEHKKPKAVGSVTIGVVNGEYSSSIFIAENRGFFRDNGLNVKVRTYFTGNDAFKAMRKGEVDVSGQADFIVLASIFKREKIQIFSTFSKFSSLIIIGRKDHGITKASDLAGKRIGLPRNTILEFYLGRFLELHGMSINDVVLVDTSYPESQNSIETGTVDALVTVPPFYFLIKKSLGSNAIEWSAQGDQKSYLLLASSDNWLIRNTDLAVRVLKAIDQANIFIEKHPNEASFIVQKRLRLDPEVAKGLWQRNTFDLSLHQQYILAMEDEARWMLENKLVDAKELPDFLDYINIDILRKVKPEKMTIIH